jgi:tetratricopeptide (TPR) repeat protein
MTPQQLFHSAVSLQQQGRLAEAESLYRQVLALAPDAVDAWINHGAALQGLGRPEEALGSYDQAVTRGPGHAAAWTNRAQLLLALNRPAPALESFDKVVRLSPRHAGAWRGRAGALFALGRSDEALASLERALEIEPADADTLYRRAAILHVEQRFAGALTALDGILAVHPGHADALTLKAALLCETGRVADGMAVYRRHAEAHFAQAPVTQPADADFKRKHDAEQRAWMHAHGIAAHGFHLEAGARTEGPAVNPVNADDVARRWAQSDPQIVVIDDLLTPDALAGLRRFAHGSTMWRRAYPNGYLGAVPEQGFLPAAGPDRPGIAKRLSHRDRRPWPGPDVGV